MGLIFMIETLTHILPSRSHSDASCFAPIPVSMLHPEPRARMTIHEANHHSWVTGLAEQFSAEQLPLPPDNAFANMTIDAGSDGGGGGGAYRRPDHHQPPPPDHSKRDGTSRDLDLALSLAGDNPQGLLLGPGAYPHHPSGQRVTLFVSTPRQS